jgi:CarD family transcriptional regulator
LYQIGQLIVYGGEGVCRVTAIGPLKMRGVPKDTNYYTLMPLYRSGTVFAPVDTTVYTRPVITREEAENLIATIPEVPAEVYETTNPRLLAEHYQEYLKNYDCGQLVRLLRSIGEKSRRAYIHGRRLGLVDERCMKQAEELLNGELAVALDIPVDDVRGYVLRSLGANNDLVYMNAFLQ